MGLLVGASMSESVLSSYKGRLVGNHIMRIFPDRVASIGGASIKVPPLWTDSRMVYCKDNNTIPFISSKGNGSDAFVAFIRDYLINMPSWVKMVYYCDWHEPEKDYGNGSSAGIAKYKAEQIKLWNMIKALPAATRAKVKFGPVLTKQWTEDSGKGNFDYSKYDPGPTVGDFFGVDSYVLTLTAGAAVSPSTMPNPVAFLATIKAYSNGSSDTRARFFPELGLIGMPADTNGSARAGWLQGIHNEVKTWKVGTGGWTKPWSFGGWCWWNTEGKATGEVPGVGQRRDFPLHLRTVDATKAVTIPNQSGKTQPAPVVTFNEIWTLENSGVTPDPDPDPDPGTEPPGPTEPYPGGSTSGGWWIGATMKKADIPTYEPKLTGNQMFRIFPNSDGLPPAWNDPRFAYAQRMGAVPFVSSNIDGDTSKFAAMRTWIINMPSWVKVLYVSDRHEPENNAKDGLTREKYLANFKAWWNACIASLPAATRARVKAGPILTKQWVEQAGKGDNDYGLYDPMKQLGLKTDFFSSDHYHNSWKPGSSENATKVAEAYMDPTAFFAIFKAYKAPTVGGVVDDRERVFAEWGAMGIPLDPDGSKRAKWITDCAKVFDTWTQASTGWRFAGACWWNNQGTSGPSLTPIGTLRFFYLDKWQKTSAGAIALPGNPTAPVKAYNDIVTAHLTSAPTPNPDPDPTPDPPDPDPTPDPDPGTDPPVDPVPDPPTDGGGGTNPDPGGTPPITLPVDTPAPSRLLQAEYQILVTDKDLNVLGDPIHEWASLQVTLRWKEPGSGQFTVPAFKYIRDQLLPGCRIVIMRTVLGRQSILLSGPMEQKLRERSDDGENGGVGKLTVTFADDMAWLAARVAYPDPTKLPKDQTTDYWLYSGNPEAGMLLLVNQQAGPGALLARQVPKLTVAAFSGISGTGTVALGPTSDVAPRERLEKLTDVLRRMASSGVGAGFDPDSLGFRTRQTQNASGANTILFEVIRSRNLAGQVHFSHDMGNLKYYSFTEEAPTLTHPIVGGSGDGADRYIDEHPSTNPSQLVWGRWEDYIPRPGTDPLAERKAAALEALLERGQTGRVSSNAADTVDCRAGVHYSVGDIVSLGLGPGEWVNAPVQTISFQAYPTAGEVVGTTIGDQSARYDTAQIRAMRLMDRRLGDVERR